MIITWMMCLCLIRAEALGLSSYCGLAVGPPLAARPAAASHTGGGWRVRSSSLVCSPPCSPSTGGGGGVHLRHGHAVHGFHHGRADVREPVRVAVVQVPLRLLLSRTVYRRGGQSGVSRACWCFGVT